MHIKELRAGDEFEYKNNVFDWRRGIVVGFKSNGQLIAEKPTGGIFTVPNSPKWKFRPFNEIQHDFDTLKSDILAIAERFERVYKCEISIKLDVKSTLTQPQPMHSDS